MFPTLILAVAISGQIVGGPAYRDPNGTIVREAPRALDPDTGLPVPWNVYQWKMQQKQLETERAAGQAEQERWQAQQGRLKARRERLKAKTAQKPMPRPAELVGPPEPATYKLERAKEARRDLAKSQEAKRRAENEQGKR